jgi:hypothetical protein
MHRMKRILAVVVAVLATFSASANQVTVQEVTTQPYEIVQISVPGFYTGGVYAGIAKLLVDGKPTDGFCIDPFHFSSTSPLLYDVVPLESAPKPPGTMGSGNADLVRKLWALNYSANMSAPLAAGLQVAIWEVVGGSNFSVIGNDYGASTLLTTAQAYNGSGADLIAVTGSGQDYVIKNIPDAGSTILLLGIACLAVTTIRKKISAEALVPVRISRRRSL